MCCLRIFSLFFWLLAPGSYYNGIVLRTILLLYFLKRQIYAIIFFSKSENKYVECLKTFYSYISLCLRFFPVVFCFGKINYIFLSLGKDNFLKLPSDWVHDIQETFYIDLFECRIHIFLCFTLNLCCHICPLSGWQ